MTQTTKARTHAHTLTHARTHTHTHTHTHTRTRTHSSTRTHTQTHTTTTITIAHDADVVAISAGGQHSLVLKRDGNVWGVGFNENGQLGDGTTTNKKSFVQSKYISGRSGGMHALS